ncbi:MAG TPA: cupin domain-containing protein [Trueperaceae bacterium]|nr:cupin domain-containing protein [Trueperaceae bacterium]
MDAATEAGLFVPARGDRFQQQRKVFGVMPFTIKVSSSDTGGRLLVIEQDNAYPGGPPRHVHHEQEEWFCAVQGTYVVEIGGEAHRLTAGASVLAPRGVPHSWALEGSEPGRLLIAFTPAGTMEAFFAATADMAGMLGPAELAPLFAAHGMAVTGPPLRGNE